MDLVQRDEISEFFLYLRPGATERSLPLPTRVQGVQHPTYPTTARRDTGDSGGARTAKNLPLELRPTGLSVLRGSIRISGGGIRSRCWLIYIPHNVGRSQPLIALDPCRWQVVPLGRLPGRGVRLRHGDAYPDPDGLSIR